MAAQHVRTSSEILANFKSNVKLMKDLKALNAFVFENTDKAKKDSEKAAERRNTGSSVRSNVDGLTFAVKDNICTKDIPTTCSSQFLRGYVPPFNATVVQLLGESGAVMIGKTNMDEFGMGSSNLYSDHGPTISPWSTYHKGNQGVLDGSDSGNQQTDDWIISGGSSGGSAVAVAAGMCDFALGSDTGGSVRLPASFCGIVGLKPTYGRVSRYGLIPLASSMDTVGMLASNVGTAASVLDVVSGFDDRDSTSIKATYESCYEEIGHDKDIGKLLKGIVIGVPKDIDIPELSPQYKSLWLSIADRLTVSNHSVVEDVSLPHFKYGVPCYNIINSAEAASNMAKYSGLAFGQQSSVSDGCKDIKTVEELFASNRVAGLGPVVQHRIIAGMYFLSYQHHYEKALGVRQLIHGDFQSVFAGSQSSEDERKSSVAVILTPVTLNTAPRRSQIARLGPVESSVYDTYTAPVNLSGLPAISVPVGLCDGLPLGIQVIGRWMDELTMIKVARAIEIIVSDQSSSSN